MAICGGELFMPKRSEQPHGDIVPGQLQVYSLDGEERRTFHGGFGKPLEFVIHLDHIYMIEERYGPSEYKDYYTDDVTTFSLCVLGIGWAWLWLSATRVARMG